MKVHHYVTLYLTATAATVIEAVQGDGVRVIAAQLMEGAEPWTVPEGVTAGISYELPGKTGGYYDQLRDYTPACMIAGNLVTAAIDSSLTAAAGNVKLAIVLRDGDGGQVATFPITLRVAKRPGRIGAEEMAPVSAYEGKLILGGKAGEFVPVDVGLGLHLERTASGATLSADGGGSGLPGGSCECSAPYVASDEPPADTRALWIDTSEPDAAVALGATVVETEEGVEIYATDELGTTRATVRHGRDGAPGAPGADGITPHIGDNGNWWIGDSDTGKPSRGEPGEGYKLTDADRQQIAEVAAGMIEVPEGGGSTGYRLIGEATTENVVNRILLEIPDGISEIFALVDVPGTDATNGVYATAWSGDSILAGNAGEVGLGKLSSTNTYYKIRIVKLGGLRICDIASTAYYPPNSQTLYAGGKAGDVTGNYFIFGVQYTAETVPIGTTVKLYGR